MNYHCYLFSDNVVGTECPGVIGVYTSRPSEGGSFVVLVDFMIDSHSF